MDMVVMDSSNGTKSNNFSFLVGKNHEIMLKESIERFLDECRKGISDFSGFSSIFFRLLQSRVDPPLETIWFYSAVRYRSSNELSEENDCLERVLKSKDLFQLISACSSSCSGVKSVAVLAPVLFDLHQLVIELSEKKNLLSKREKKAMRELVCLVDGIISYISICACNNYDGEEFSVGLVHCFADLVRVWTIDESKGKNDIKEVMRVFFPLVSDEIRDGFNGLEVRIDYLAGVVIVESFLLSLCLKFNGDSGKSELQKELKTWAVGAVTAFRNCYFFGMLLRLLLEPTLPVTSLLGSEDEALLRKVLYDVVILVEYSFLTPEGESGTSSDFMKNLAITRLIVVHEAVQVSRSNKEQTKAISYINALSNSRLPSQLVKWASYQTGMDQKASKLNVSSPQALLKWLLNLENQGVQVFDLKNSKLYPKLIADLSKLDNEESVFKKDKKSADEDLFYIDSKGEGEEADNGEGDREMIDSMDSAFLAAAQRMKSATHDTRRKRKDNRKGDESVKVKFQKYDLSRVQLPSGDDGKSSESEVENPTSDEDIEEMVE